MPTILLAEDSDDDAFFFQRAFGRASLSYQLLRANNGKIAVELLGKSSSHGGTPALIFLDLKMPVMSGFDVLQWLKSSELNPKPAVVVLSGSSDQADQTRAFNLGAADYLVKPITPDVLRESVLRLARTSDHSTSELGARS